MGAANSKQGNPVAFQPLSAYGRGFYASLEDLENRANGPIDIGCLINPRPHGHFVRQLARFLDSRATSCAALAHGRRHASDASACGGDKGAALDHPFKNSLVYRPQFLFRVERTS